MSQNMAFGKLFATKTCTIRKKALTLQSETQTVKNKCPYAESGYYLFGKLGRVVATLQ